MTLLSGMGPAGQDAGETTYPPKRGMGLGAGKGRRRVVKAAERSSNAPRELRNLRHSFFFKLTPWGPGSRRCQSSFASPGPLPGRNRQCFLATYFKNLFCYLQASHAREGDFVDRGGGQGSRMAAERPCSHVPHATELKSQKTPPGEKTRGHPYVPLVFMS